ncbi:MAG TPA: PQQ-dependent sugar dehydrogenase, partial [Candidatus Polarisedimenticolaceae bacterium]|nr:PQQ-dependent sugar dehydrogenase [Candidatus Polarisedimenticolaceae bacterium]
QKPAWSSLSTIGIRVIAPSRDDLLYGECISRLEGKHSGGLPESGIAGSSRDEGWPGCARERYLSELNERIRDVRQGPDGLVYLVTDSRDGRLLRFGPARR